MAERLDFADGAMPYSVIGSAEHLTRYASLRHLVSGKTVLDAACGEGYGSPLLAQAGAASVLGIDISEQAIAKAKARFGHPNVAYAVGDACFLDRIIPTATRFDVICSFETIEHVSDPGAFLSGLNRLRAPDGIVAISAPNDLVLPDGCDNPYHLRRYTLESFKVETEAVLGKATRWFLGAPIQGLSLFDEPVATPTNADQNIALQGHDAGTLHIIPPPPYAPLDAGNAAFWLGVWGDIRDVCAVASPMSMLGFLEPYRAIDGFKKQIEFKDAEIRRLESLIAEERRLALDSASQTRFRAGRISDIDPKIIHDIAREVWYERQRWGLPYKIGNWYRKQFHR